MSSARPWRAASWDSTLENSDSFFVPRPRSQSRARSQQRCPAGQEATDGKLECATDAKFVVAPEVGKALPVRSSEDATPSTERCCESASRSSGPSSRTQSPDSLASWGSGGCKPRRPLSQPLFSGQPRRSLSQFSSQAVPRCISDADTHRSTRNNSEADEVLQSVRAPCSVSEADISSPLSAAADSFHVSTRSSSSKPILENHDVGCLDPTDLNNVWQTVSSLWTSRCSETSTETSLWSYVVGNSPWRCTSAESGRHRRSWSAASTCDGQARDGSAPGCRQQMKHDRVSACSASYGSGCISADRIPCPRFSGAQASVGRSMSDYTVPATPRVARKQEEWEIVSQRMPATYSSYEWVRKGLAVPLMRARDLGRAHHYLKEADEIHMRIFGQPSKEVAFNMACCFSLGASASLHGSFTEVCDDARGLPPELPGARRGDLVHARLDLAVCALRSAVALGFCDMKHLQFEGDLHTLREWRFIEFTEICECAAMSPSPGSSERQPQKWQLPPQRTTSAHLPQQQTGSGLLASLSTTIGSGLSPSNSGQRAPPSATGSSFLASLSTIGSGIIPLTASSSGTQLAGARQSYTTQSSGGMPVMERDPSAPHKKRYHC